ncbi:MAG: type II toxin-antitoxin system Phd/YefM family antitoxin [Gemmatimonadetes bacterium]|nr:type II toxin-antitoxin system Phd/YefM family antitoxin [Gemmatimonadota bacterium]
MTVVTVHRAKTNLSKLIARALAGEEIVIARGDTPAVRLVPVTAPVPRRVPGTLKGKIEVTDAFFEPLPPEELDAWGQ